MVKINGQKLADLGFYINLDKRVDRKEQILKNLENFNITGVERYSARCEGDSPNINLINSTIDIYKKFLESDAETLLVLEDDCNFLEPLNRDSKTILSNIHSTEWDVFYLGCYNRRPPIFYKNNCYRVSSISYTQSYLIKRKITEEIVRWDTGFGVGHIDEFLCLFAYSPEIASDPNSFEFYKKEQPLDCFESKYKSLTYKYALSTQYNSYSNLWHKEALLSDYISSSHPEKYINE
jgi:hypothetical protein